MLQPIIKQLNSKRIVLASSSPRRKELLQNIVCFYYNYSILYIEYILHTFLSFFFKGLNVELCASTFEENLSINDFNGFSEFVEETALQKVLEVENRLSKTAIDMNQPKPDIVIGADTMVSLNGRLYGKPKNKQDAVETLQK